MKHFFLVGPTSEIGIATTLSSAWVLQVALTFGFAIATLACDRLDVRQPDQLRRDVGLGAGWEYLCLAGTGSILRLRCWAQSVEPSSSLRSTLRIKKNARRVLVPTVLEKDEVTETLWRVSS